MINFRDLIVFPSRSQAKYRRGRWKVSQHSFSPHVTESKRQPDLMKNSIYSRPVFRLAPTPVQKNPQRIIAREAGMVFRARSLSHAHCDDSRSVVLLVMERISPAHCLEHSAEIKVG